MEKKKLTNEELEYCIKEFSDGKAYFFKNGITVSLKDLCEEIKELRREKLLLGGKARFRKEYKNMTIRELLNMKYEKMPKEIIIDNYYKFKRTNSKDLLKLYKNEDNEYWLEAEYICLDDKIEVVKNEEVSDELEKLDEVIAYEQGEYCISWSPQEKILVQTINKIMDRIKELEEKNK